ncbi:hypothetical protein [Myroides odoratimimus]|uniref:hypothetical protein n=1 Tax=Myroides odoratimimus TaxID=76832 RepID=UPI0013B39D2C|nr:hypothetical protein [Myroides odoratimimus]
MMKIVSKFELEEVVYFKTDSEQSEYIVTGFKVRGTKENPLILYLVSCMGHEVGAYEYELSSDKNIKKQLGVH